MTDFISPHHIILQCYINGLIDVRREGGRDIEMDRQMGGYIYRHNGLF